ncbi:MAG TPA: hypothetical protein PLI57_02060 [Spirochaetota bacterium]|nr:hypothetical protein [Spirochaetota bacterium]
MGAVDFDFNKESPLLPIVEIFSLSIFFRSILALTELLALAIISSNSDEISSLF